MLSLVQKEAEAQATYYRVDQICDKLNLPVPPQKQVIKKLKEIGFQAVLTHFNSRGFKTDASADIVNEVVSDLATQKG